MYTDAFMLSARSDWTPFGRRQPVLYKQNTAGHEEYEAEAEKRTKEEETLEED